MNVTQLNGQLANINSYGSAEEAMVVRGLHLNILIDKLNEIIDYLNDDSLTSIDKVKIFSYQYSTGNDTSIMRGIHLSQMISKINEMITTESLPITSLDTRLIYRNDYRTADDSAPVRTFYLNLVLSKINQVCGGGQSWESEWSARSLFWSDGTIVADKLGVKYGTDTNAPTLVDSYCLTMAVNDTIAFTSLVGWSIISSGGTAVIEISGNNVLCTTGGSLYNLIMSDGINTHYYPLSMGASTNCVDTGDVPIDGTIVCADLVWGLQSAYHKNIEGYNKYTYKRPSIYQNFVDTAAAGIPDGWNDMWGKGAASVEAGGVVRCTAKAGMTDYYQCSVYKYGAVTVGVKYIAVVRARASKNMAMQLRIGSATAVKQVTITTDWATYTFPEITADQTYFGIMLGAAVHQVDDWFEFDYVSVGVSAEESYVPKRENSDLDAYGNAITTLGNGYFINAETKLLFPDNASLLATDDRMNFFYDEVAGTQLKKSYSDIHPNVFNYKPCDRIFSRKVDGRLTELLILDVSKTYTRSQFITLLEYFSLPTYIFTKIDKGAVLLCGISGYSPEVAFQTASRTTLNALGASVCYLQAQDVIAPGSVTLVNTFLDQGNYMWTVMQANKGNLADDLLDGEETEFAAEIASGELIVVDSPGGKRGAFPKIDYPDYVVPANLVNTTKTNASVILTTHLDGYNQLVWIPAGQSGVPAALEEIPLWVNPYDSYKLYYYKWEASAFFSATFTNGDAINVYKMEGTQYRNLVSIHGLKCIKKHLRNYFEQMGVRYLAGYWETPNGPNYYAGGVNFIGSKAIWDAGMLFGTQNAGFGTPNRWLSYQNNPREWAMLFNHHWANWDVDPIENVLNDLEGIASGNVIAGVQNYPAWNAAAWAAIWAKCQTLGIIVMSPPDFVRNVRFNDY